MTTVELRAKFEAHFSQPPYEWSFARYTERQAWPGSYARYNVQCAWESYQAAHTSRDAEVEALQDALFQISVRLKADHEPDMDDMSWHTDMIARAQYFANVVTEVEALRKDAERYRWIRNTDYEDLDETLVREVSVDFSVSMRQGDDLDKAIDDAMREGE